MDNLNEKELVKIDERNDGEVAKVHEKLSRIKGYEGASGRITFDADRRVNNALSLLKIDRDTYKSVMTNDLPILGNDLEIFLQYDHSSGKD